MLARGGATAVSRAVLGAVFADVMAETPKPPVEGRGDRSPEQDGGPDLPGAVSGSADDGGDGSDATVAASAHLPELDQSSLVALGDVGRRWDGCMPPREIWEPRVACRSRARFRRSAALARGALRPYPKRGGRDDGR